MVASRDIDGEFRLEDCEPERLDDDERLRLHDDELVADDIIVEDFVVEMEIVSDCVSEGFSEADDDTVGDCRQTGAACHVQLFT